MDSNSFLNDQQRLLHHLKEMMVLRFEIIIPKARIYRVDHHFHIRQLHLRVELNLDAIFLNRLREEIYVIL